MKSFKDIISNDINSTFFNVNEFSEVHNIDGIDMTIQIDNDLLKERQAKFAEGTYWGDVLFLVKKSDFGEPSAIGERIKFDGDPMRVTDFQKESDIYIITLGANMS